MSLTVVVGKGGEGGMRPGRHLERRKYGILKYSRFWQIGVCIADSKRVFYTTNTPPVLRPHNPLTVIAPSPHRKQCVDQETYTDDLTEHSPAVKL